MQLGITDVVLLLILAGAFLLGFFQGAIRQLLGLLSWLVAFLLAANLREPVGNYLAGYWTHLPSGYSHMIAFGLVFLVVFVLANILTQLRYRRQPLHKRVTVLDEILGGVLGVGLAVLVIATLIVGLDSFYARGGGGGNDVTWITQTWRSLGGSTVANGLRASLIPGLLTILGPLLPSQIRDVAR